MRDLNLMVWITQLGLSVAVPLAGFVLLAVWLREKLGWGDWVLWVGIGLGCLMAVDGFLNSLKILKKLSAKKDKGSEPPAVSFNDHD